MTRLGSSDALRPSRDRRARRGSEISDRQVAQAAIRGRQVVFRWLNTQPQHEVRGYVVGMDDYHWMVAVPLPEEMLQDDGGDPIAIHLVHRSASLIVLPPQATLAFEPTVVQDALRRIGQKFWQYCESNYANRNSSVAQLQEN